MTSLTDVELLEAGAHPVPPDVDSPVRETTAPRTAARLRVGIITIMDPSNYGNRLQNYALQAALQKLGCDTRSFQSDAYADKKLLRKLGRVIGRLCLYHHEGGLQKIVDKFFLVRRKRRKTQNLAPLLHEKVAKGEVFNKRHLKIADEPIRQGADHPGAADYDFFVVGSDQVWNPYYREGSDIDFLRFVAPEKRIAYSASFSVASIPACYQRRYAAGLRGMAAISVREDQGAKIVRDITGREVPVTVDPTMLLDGNEWRTLCAPHPDKPAKGYYLTYFIGGRPDAFDRTLQRQARERGLTVVNLASDKGEDRKFYAASPTEFIDFIRNAEAVFTNSFHGVVFSIIFGRNFLVFDRQDTGDRSMNSRLDTLLGRFQLNANQRDFRTFSATDVDSAVSLRDDAPLTTAREQSLDYLRQALRIS